MVVFPNAKINLGLNVVSRRDDGYHNLDMVMIPVGWKDILEIVPSKTGKTTLSVSGNHIECPTEKNLVYKAWRALNDYIENNLPAVDIYLHKTIPDGAGLGGGSSDAAFTLTTLNRLFEIGLTDEELCRLATSLGADCPFFIHNRPMYCTGTGTTMSPVCINWGNISHILIAKPKNISVSTAEAYSGVVPAAPTLSAAETVTEYPPAKWRGLLHNRFEDHIFKLKPGISDLKQTIESFGAVYTSMSGSGSAVYGLFDNVKMAEQAAGWLGDCYVNVSKVSDEARI